MATKPMIEQVFTLTKGPEKTVEKIIQDERMNYIHMLFNKNEALPVHRANSNVYMTVLQGSLSIGLGDQDIAIYPAGTLLLIPYKTRMNVQNLHDEPLELIVIKVPSPKYFNE